MRKSILFTLLLISFSVGAIQPSEVIIPSTDAAAVSRAFQVTRNNGLVTVFLYSAVGLVANEFADIQISHDSGITFQDLYADGAQVRLSNVNNAISIYGLGTYRIDMDDPTNAVTVYLNSGKSL